MILQPIDFVVYAWLIIAVLSAIYVAYDQFRYNPEAPVMKWGFVLVTLYMGPIGRFQADVINVGPGQRYDVIWPAKEPGKWILHCHIPHHTLNNNVEEKGAGGLTVLVEVSP